MKSNRIAMDLDTGGKGGVCSGSNTMANYCT